MLAIGIEAEFRYVAISFFGWGLKGELNAPITAEREVVDFLRRRHSYSCSSDLL
jgi:hypothetical protein